MKPMPVTTPCMIFAFTVALAPNTDIAVCTRPQLAMATRGKARSLRFVPRAPDAIYGGPEVLKYGDLPDPVAGPGEVVIDVVAASVNGADWKVRIGQYKQSKFPFVLGRIFPA
jgi:hypothetical protein